MFRLTWRNLVARKMRLLMSALAIVLGVGFLAGVLTFSGGLSRTFDGISTGSTPDAVARPRGADAVQGQPVGTGEKILRSKIVKRLAELPEVARADGSVEGQSLTILDKDGKLVGLGGAPTIAFNYTDAPNMLGGQPLKLVSGRLPAADDEILLDTRSAERAGYRVGDKVKALNPPTMVTRPDPSAVDPDSIDPNAVDPGTVDPGTVDPSTVDPSAVDPGAVEPAPSQELQRRFKLVGTMDFTGGTAGATMVVLSTHGAQKLFLAGGDGYTSIGLTAAEGVSQRELAAAANKYMPVGFEVVTGDAVVAEIDSTVGELLGFITVFLGVFAVIAVIVGGFIIANTFSILVAQRVRELALLRAMGASRRQIRSSVLLEAMLMAIIGSSIGLAVGLGLARALAALFGYFGLEIDGSVLTLSLTTIIAAYAIGLAVTMTSAFLPARRASQVAPVAAMREDATMTERSLHRRTLIGAVFLVIGAGFAAAGELNAPGNNATYVGIGAVIWVLTVAAISSVLGRPVLSACRAVFGKIFGTTGRLAGDNAIRNPRRTGATASALMIGLALVSAVGVLAASMSKTMDDIVDEQFAADFLVQSQVYQPFSPVLGNKMEKLDGVSVVSRQQLVMATVNGYKETEYVVGTDENFAKIYQLPMVEGTQQVSGNTTFVAESVADEHDLTLGAKVTLGISGGEAVRVKVVGITEDSEAAGGFNVPYSVLKKAGVSRSDYSLSINLAAGADKEEVRQQLEKIAKEVPIVAVQDKQQFADSLKAQVNQLLYIVYGLLALSVVIAIIGIVNTLSLSVLERTREIGLLRAVGLSRRRLRRMISLESVTISVMGAVLGLGLGVLIGVLLQRSLSEDLTSLGLPWGSLVVFMAIAVVFGVLAAIVPAVRASRMKVLEAIATE